MSGTGTEDINDQLDEMAMQLLILCQSLVDTKLALENFMKEGFILLAKARYAMNGPTSVSKLQLPNEDWEPFAANSKVILRHCERHEIGVKFNYLSLEVEVHQVENLTSGLTHRKAKVKDDQVIQKQKKDPIRWFGVLTPQALKQGQRHFSKSIELSIEATNLQNEIRGLVIKRQILLRQLKKKLATNETTAD